MQKVNEKPDTTFKFTVVEEKGDEVIIEVAPEDYAREMAAGVLPEETLPPGRHKFIRGGFRKRFPHFDPATAKTTVEIELGMDYEVLEYFKQLARDTQADSYQTVINQVLYAAMEQGKRQTSSLPAEQDTLLGNPQFIEAVAERVKQTLTQQTPAKKAAIVNKPRRRAA
jgi:hypothetical protein